MRRLRPDAAVLAALGGLLLLLQSAVLQAQILEFIVEPEDTIVIPGNSAVLHCIAKSNEYPDDKITIDWLDKDRQKLNFDVERERFLHANGSLLIRNVEEDRQLTGIYQCRATLQDVGAIVSRNATVKLASLSGFLEEPEDLNLIPGYTAYFPCRVEADPPPVVKWLKNEVPLVLNEVRMMVLPSGALQIDDVEPSDQGSYRCNASGLNQYRLSNRANLHLETVDEPEPTVPVFIAKPKSQTFIEGQTVVLDCAANSLPKPIVVWIKDGIPIDMAYLDTRFSQIGSSLRISDIRETDTGNYICRADNNVDSADAPADIKVLVPPRFEKKPENQKGEKNTDLMFECKIYGLPRPYIQWLKNGEILNYNGYTIVNGSSLRITGLMSNDDGIFQCVGQNDAGNIQAAARLQVVGPMDRSYSSKNRQRPSLTQKKPTRLSKTPFPSQIKAEANTNNHKAKEFSHSIFNSLRSTDNSSSTNLGVVENGRLGPPRDLRTEAVRPRLITLRWRPPDDSPEITHYKVYYREEGSERERYSKVDGSRNEDSISGLSPARIYHFRVEPFNSLGQGQSSEVLRVSTLPEEHVPTAPVNIRAYATSPSSIHLSWKEPEMPNGPILKYKIFYSDIETLVERSKESESLSCEITGLNEYTEYVLWIVAINRNGSGDKSDDLVVRTFSALPTETPQEVSAVASSSQSITVRWEPPPKEDRNGVITGYKIKYKRPNRKGESVTVPSTTRNYVIGGLDKATTYQIKLWAMNVNGTGPGTDWLLVETEANDADESTVPSEPGSFRVDAKSTRITAYWTPPVNSNVKVRSYILGWGKGVPDFYSNELDEHVREYLIENLDRNSEYVISLRASNNMGPGPPVYNNVMTRNESELHDLQLFTPLEVKATIIGPHAAMLHWMDIELGNKRAPTDNRVYTVMYTPVDNPKNRYINTTELNIVIKDLRPHTTYEFSVRIAKDGYTSPWSLVVQNTTEEAAPSSAPRDLNVNAIDEDAMLLNLTWQPPKVANGQVTGYLLLYTTDDTKKDIDWFVHGIVNDVHSVVLDNLQPTTTYFFKIQARNTKGYGPYSQVVSYRTGKDGKWNSMIVYVAVGGAVAFLSAVAVFLVVFCCRKKDPNISPDRKKKTQKGDAKSPSVKPPDLWIHHDLMELKNLDKSHASNDGASSSGALTLPRSVGNDYDAHDSHLTNSLDKRNYGPNYMGSPSPDDKPSNSRRVLKAKPIITLPMDSKALKEPVATATPISGGESVVGRVPYPRTQYHISRAHVTLDQASAHQENPYAMQMSYELQSPHYIVSQPTPPMSASASSNYAPGLSVLAESQAGKRLQQHPLRSFSVPAPPPTSAPGTPQSKHIVQSPQVTIRPNSSPYKKVAAMGAPSASASASALAPASTSRISASNPPPHTSEEVQRLAPSYSTEELNQEMANLEGLMKDLNAITASEFEC